jgi:hypothetical protein
MSDPTSEAIKSVAETAGKAIDVVAPGAEPIIRTTGGIIENALGYYIGDSLTHRRMRNLKRLQDETNEILLSRGATQTRQLSITLGAPLLTEAQNESRDELVTRARLLANAIDGDRPDRLRIEFIDVLKQLHPQDALVFETVMRTEPSPRESSQNVIAAELGLSQDSLYVSVQTLMKLGCLSGDSANFIVTPFGRELLLACQA